MRGGMEDSGYDEAMQEIMRGGIEDSGCNEAV